MCVNCREEPDTPAPPVKRGRVLKPPLLRPREAATFELSDDARPCCHATGPNHHPACTTNRTEQQQ